MTTTESGLKILGDNDFYKVSDFNENFLAVERLINEITQSLNGSINALTQSVNGSINTITQSMQTMQTSITAASRPALVGGIVSANGTYHFDFQPTAVIVMSQTMGSLSNTTSVWCPPGKILGIAVRGGEQIHPTQSGVATQYISLQISGSSFTAQGFWGSVSAG
jgi:hypothetical protein